MPCVLLSRAAYRRIPLLRQIDYDVMSWRLGGIYAEQIAMELDFRKDIRILANIVDTIMAGVFTVDARGNFVAWNRGAEKITGYSESDLVGRPCTSLTGCD